MSGFEVYNSSGALTIDSNNKSVVMSTVQAMGALDSASVGYYVLSTAFGNGSTLGYRLTDMPSGLVWFQLQTNGAYCFPGAGLFAAGTGRFMSSSNTAGLTSGYLDVYNASGTLIWSAASAGSMPRIRDFFTVPAGYNLATALTVTTSFADPWFCVSQCPGNLSDDGETVGYSGLLVRRNTSTSFSLQYVNVNQYAYATTMGSSGLSIALCSFTGY